MQMSYFHFVRIPIFQNYHQAITFSSIISSLLSILSSRHFSIHLNSPPLFQNYAMQFFSLLWKLFQRRNKFGKEFGEGGKKNNIWTGRNLTTTTNFSWKSDYSFLFFSPQNRETDVNGRRKCRVRAKVVVDDKVASQDDSRWIRIDRISVDKGW